MHLWHSKPTVTFQSLAGDEGRKKYLLRQGGTRVIPESVIFSPILRSNKPEAKSFSPPAGYASPYAME